MGYLIELSINIKKITNVTQIKDDIKLVADKNNCCFMYDIYEYSVDNRYAYRNHCVITMEFPGDDEKLISFVKKIRNIKNVYIEMLSYEDVQYNIMYASKKYLQMMEKPEAKSYLKSKKEKTLFKYDSELMKIIRNERT
mgnify:CR=1 FL=1|tara:strand:- start:1233 stop:1649 length:417 start_codon:yes stop_codon:yes gene_type:complete